MYLVEKENKYRSIGLFLTSLLFIAVISFWVYVFLSHFSRIVAEIAAVLLLIIYIILIIPAEEMLWLFKRYSKGLFGEEWVRSLLKNLPDDFVVFENLVLPSMKSNIDFVVVGPTGIFTIEVKSHKGTVTYDGFQLLHNGGSFKEKDILRQTKGESIRLTDYLHSKNISFPEIQPVIVFSNKYVGIHFGKTPIQGVFVIGASWLIDIIQHSMNRTVLTVP